VLFINKICYIVGASECDDLCIENRKNSLVIAADGGYEVLLKHNIIPDIAVGDFDSLGYIPKEVEVIRHPVEKDDTDTALALKEGIKRGYNKFILFGCLGGRLDHTLANIQMLSYALDKGCECYILGSGTVITAINDKICFDSYHKGNISVFCVGGKTYDVSISGLKYELNNAVLTDSVSLGVSNSFIGKNSEISVKNGKLVIMWDESSKSFTERMFKNSVGLKDICEK